MNAVMVNKYEYFSGDRNNGIYHESIYKREERLFESWTQAGGGSARKTKLFAVYSS